MALKDGVPDAAAAICVATPRQGPLSDFHMCWDVEAAMPALYKRTWTKGVVAATKCVFAGPPVSQ
jgi:hypothetical protein